MDGGMGALGTNFGFGAGLGLEVAASFTIMLEGGTIISAGLKLIGSQLHCLKLIKQTFSFIVGFLTGVWITALFRESNTIEEIGFESGEPFATKCCSCSTTDKRLEIVGMHEFQKYLVSSVEKLASKETLSLERSCQT